MASREREVVLREAVVGWQWVLGSLGEVGLVAILGVMQKHHDKCHVHGVRGWIVSPEFVC